MAQIVTITNPLTGQPTQVDQLEHTAQQIDDAIARALPGGAIDIALQNKAPSGFGYGDTQSIAFWDDEDGTKLEQFLETKFAPASMRSKVYRANLVDRPICKISGNGGFADIIANNGNDPNGYPENIMIVYYAFNQNITGPSIAVKQKINGTWYPWEYVNPPMEPGEEYRTTERYNKKPVYVMTKDYGLVQEKNTPKSENIPENAGYGWVVNGLVTYYGTPIPSWNDDGSLRFGASYNQGSGSISFIANEDRVNPNARYVLTIKYVKTTD